MIASNRVLFRAVACVVLLATAALNFASAGKIHSKVDSEGGIGPEGPIGWPPRVPTMSLDLARHLGSPDR